jgi:hypothetical protein
MGISLPSEEGVVMANNPHKFKTADERKPRKDTLSIDTVYGYESKCRADIMRHHYEMQHDPERLTTEFLINITGCKCTGSKWRRIL